MLPSAIVNACEEMGVPRPGSGHWTLVRRGWEIPRAALSAREEGRPASVVIRATHSRGRRASGEAAPVIAVASEARSLHPLVARMRSALKAEEPDRVYGVMIPHWRQKFFRVRVSKGQVDRAMCILDALVKAVEARGARFVKKKDAELMELTRGDETVDFIMSEEMERSERVPKDEEERKSYWWHKYEYASTGRLRFVIDGFAPGACQKKWGDCERYRLEEKVGEMVQSVFAVFEGIRVERAKMEERHRAWEQERRKGEEVERLRRLEEGARKNLEEQAARWVGARQVREFVGACEAVLRAGAPELSADGWEVKWLAWAQDCADGLDPLKNGFLERERRRVGG